MKDIKKINEAFFSDKSLVVGNWIFNDKGL